MNRLLNWFQIILILGWPLLHLGIELIYGSMSSIAFYALLFLPLGYFQLKYTLVYIQYCRVFREQRLLFYLNLLSVVLEIILMQLGIFYLGINMVILSSTIIAGLRATYLEYRFFTVHNLYNDFLLGIRLILPFVYTFSYSWAFF